MDDVQWIQYFGLGSSSSCDFFKKINLLTNYCLPSCSLKRCQQGLAFLHDASDDWELGPEPAAFSLFGPSSKKFAPEYFVRVFSLSLSAKQTNKTQTKPSLFFPLPTTFGKQFLFYF